MSDQAFSLYEPLTAEQVLLMYDMFKNQNSFKPLVECRLFYTICYIICEVCKKEQPSRTDASAFPQFVQKIVDAV